MSFDGIRVLITGHTGFKGSWLCELMLELGADVIGISLPVTEQNKLFKSINLQKRIQHFTGDIRDYDFIEKLISDIRPDIIFHLAAQPLVLVGYEQPRDTFTTNLTGSLNIFEAVRTISEKHETWKCSIVNVTTDKVYDNQEWSFAYRENDKLGGFDPYSSSKAANELIAQAYQRSFFHADSPIDLVCARAGNVIGGGDYAQHRLIPDCIRSFQAGTKLQVRNLNANRPWPHVLDPLWGYIKIAQKLYFSSVNKEVSTGQTNLSGAYNFGPFSNSIKSVGTVIKEVNKYINIEFTSNEEEVYHEAQNLSLSHDLAFRELNWSPQWKFEEALSKTINWSYEVLNGVDPREATRSDIKCCISETT